MKITLPIFFRLIALIMFWGSNALSELAAQTPQGIPTETEPIDMQDSSDVWLYIIVPAIFIIVFLGLRYFRKTGQEG
jgi:Na+/H+ antiporter NhaC